MMKTMAAWAPAEGDKGQAGSRGAAATVLTQVTPRPLCPGGKRAVYTGGVQHPMGAGGKARETTIPKGPMRSF